MNLGALIKQEIKRQGRKQKDVAKSIGISSNTISQICIGNVFPHKSTLEKICEFLGVDIEFSIVKTNIMEEKMNETSEVDIKIDINQEGYYQYRKPELRERTRQRLTEIASCGMEEVGLGQFGYKDAISGLYIEMVWSYADKDFESYMNWAKTKIKKFRESKNSGFTSIIVLAN